MSLVIICSKGTFTRSQVAGYKRAPRYHTAGLGCLTTAGLIRFRESFLVSAFSILSDNRTPHPAVSWEFTSARSLEARGIDLPASGKCPGHNKPGNLISHATLRASPTRTLTFWFGVHPENPTGARALGITVYPKQRKAKRTKLCKMALIALRKQ